jgi:S-adenosylmethionine-diacylgycerolhomoserine-N-methlytransferase
MAPSTSPASPPLSEPADRFGLAALEGFYGFHAAIYDWSRPLLLRGRAQAVAALAPTPGERVLDVGCGTGWSLPRIAASGARVTGIEPCAAMRSRASERLARLGLAEAVRLDPRPYGSHAEYEGKADAILFSYSLSMIPPFALVLERARRDLRPGGRIVVVDFLDSVGPVGFGLRRSHVELGPARLELLRRLFEPHRALLRSLGLWSYFVFRGEPAAGIRTP